MITLYHYDEAKFTVENNKMLNYSITIIIDFSKENFIVKILNLTNTSSVRRAPSEGGNFHLKNSIFFLIISLSADKIYDSLPEN